MPLRAAVLGTGAWARRIHLPGLASHPGTELVGVWGRDESAARDAGAPFGVPAFGSLADLLEAVDLVSIAVPPAAQVPLALAATAEGVHLVLEKPTAVDAAGCRRVEAAARDAGVEASVFLSRLWDPARQAWLAAAAATAWSAISYDWVSAGMRPGMPGAEGWRQGMGPLLDIAPHVVSMAEAIAGPVDRVDDASTDDRGRLLLTLRHLRGCTTSARIDLLAPVSSTHESIALVSGDVREQWSNAEAVDFPAAYRALLDDLLRRVSDPGATSPRGDESGLASACAMAELFDEAARRLAARGA